MADFCAGVMDEFHEAGKLGEGELCGEIGDDRLFFGGRQCGERCAGSVAEFAEEDFAEEMGECSGEGSEVDAFLGERFEGDDGSVEIACAESGDEIKHGFSFGNAEYGGGFGSGDMFVFESDRLREEALGVAHAAFGRERDHFEGIGVDGDAFGLSDAGEFVDNGGG